MGSEYHPALSKLSWLFGVWESVEAVMTYPTLDNVNYYEVIEYLPTDQPWMDYKSETWHSEKKTKLHCERGFLRVDPNSNKAALLVSHMFGMVEKCDGSVDKECLNLESTSLSEITFGTTPAVVKVVRKLELKGEELHSTTLMATAKTPLVKHLESRYRKKK